MSLILNGNNIPGIGKVAIGNSLGELDFSDVGEDGAVLMSKGPGQAPVFSKTDISLESSFLGDADCNTINGVSISSSDDNIFYLLRGNNTFTVDETSTVSSKMGRIASSEDDVLVADNSGGVKTTGAQRTAFNKDFASTNQAMVGTSLDTVLSPALLKTVHRWEDGLTQTISIDPDNEDTIIKVWTDSDDNEIARQETNFSFDAFANEVMTEIFTHGVVQTSTITTFYSDSVVTTKQEEIV